MLTLRDLKKTYKTAAGDVEALRGISLSFRASEFVAVLGPSGCGKTTLLNLIGGLDRATAGDLVIDGVSTARYKDRDWDAYRNHCVGFVFQSYNLIPHQTVLENVELALTLSGVSRAEKRQRAVQVLERVGLSDQLNKRPNMLSGGQMQRVAIARALVNDPAIVLADEPTGALDSETSLQIMEILKEVSKDRLVVMVTHNPDLAERYATRTVHLSDGRVTGDSDPFDGVESGSSLTLTRTHMSFFTALSLSLRNLLTKKARTILTAFAGSIGIIGIALILSLSNGVERYIDNVEARTLGEYPLTIDSETTDMQSMLSAMTGYTAGKMTEQHEDGYVYSANIISAIFDTMASGLKDNDMLSFRQVLEDARQGELKDAVSYIGYDYSVVPRVYAADTEGGAKQLNPTTMWDFVYGNTAGSMMMSLSAYSSAGQNSSVWRELTGEEKDSGYTLLAGSWPKEKDELLLIVTSDGYISDYTQFGLGLRDSSELEAMMQGVMSGKTYLPEEVRYTYADLMGLTFRLLVPTDLYVNEDGVFVDRSGDEAFLAEKVGSSLLLRITGIASAPSGTASVPGTVGYTSALSRYIMDSAAQSEVVRAQLASPNTDVLTGMPFSTGSGLTIEDVNRFIESLPDEQKAMVEPYIAGRPDDEVIGMMASYIPTSSATLTENLDKLGYVPDGRPTSIRIYADSFEDKERITSFIDRYNERMRADGREDMVIRYTDYVGLLMSSVTTITNTISYVLIAFVSVSLIVSSIMIGVITYISVLERTKEIGILRSVGASKRDVARVFNAETVIVGLTSGLMGIGVTLLLTIPINIILKDLTDISSLAYLQPLAAAALVAISVLLTLIAGILPSRLASRRDPVVALRTE